MITISLFQHYFIIIIIAIIPIFHMIGLSPPANGGTSHGPDGLPAAQAARGLRRLRRIRRREAAGPQAPRPGDAVEHINNMVLTW